MRWNSVSRKDIFKLAAVLQLPDKFKCQNRVAVYPIEGLCVLLRRFTYPCRYADLIPRFGKPISQLWMVKNLVVDYIFEKYGDLLDSYEAWLSQDRLKVFADAVRKKGAALDNCWGFVDGTVMPICKPK